MVFHVGVNLFKFYVYDEVKKETSEFSLKERFDDASAIDRVYDEIKSKINGEFGFLCVYLFQASNDFRKKIVSSGLACGFQQIQILDHISELYIGAMLQSNYKPKNDDVIWIFDGHRCHVWKKINNSAKYFGETTEDFIEKTDLEKMKRKLNELPNIILCNLKFEEGFLEDFAPQANIFAYSAILNSKNVITKAQIMAGIPEVMALDANAVVDNTITLRIGKIPLSVWTKNLPFKKSMRSNVKEDEKTLIIDYGRCVESIELPVGGDIVVILEIDINGIYSISIKNEKREHCEQGCPEFRIGFRIP